MKTCLNIFFRTKESAIKMGVDDDKGLGIRRRVLSPAWHRNYNLYQEVGTCTYVLGLGGGRSFEEGSLGAA